MSGELASRAYCWRLERRDGHGVALTSHDQAIEQDGVWHDPVPGMTPASIKRSLGLEPSDCEIEGAISAAAIREADLIAGRWDGAGLALSVAEWDNPGASAVPLMAGRLGRVDTKASEFSAELVGAAEALRDPVCPRTSPECRATLGDRQCRVDMAGRTVRASVVTSDGDELAIDQDVGDAFAFGTLRILAGRANGLMFTILAVDDDIVTLRGADMTPIEAGTPVLLTQGCDKRLATCSGRFGNATNFRGEPHLPGNDLLTRYPGG